MSEQTPACSEQPGGPSAVPSPVVVSQGLTYRELQRAIFLTFGLFIIYQLSGPLTTLLLFFLLVFILAAVINPLAVRMQRRGWPRIATALAVAAGFMGFLAVMGLIGFPPLINEVGEFFGTLPEKQERLSTLYDDLVNRYPGIAEQLPSAETVIQGAGKIVGAVLSQVGRYTLNLVAGVLSLLLLLVLVVFTVAHPQPLIAGLLAAMPRDQKDRMASALRRILYQLERWAFGSLTLGVIIGLMTAAGLWLLGMITGERVPYILMFSLIAGVGEMVPNIGPVVSAIPPVLVALTIDPMLAVWVMVLFIVIQQLENNLIVPVVMGQSLNLHPISVTFTVLMMGVLFGLLGAVLAVPVCAIIKVLWEEFYLIPRETDGKALEAEAEEIVNSVVPPRAVPPEPEQTAEPERTPELEHPPERETPA